MLDGIGARPLLLAGAASVTGVLLVGVGAWPAAGALVAATVWALLRRRPALWVCAAALAAGVASGARARAAAERSGDLMRALRARSPPRTASVELTVSAAGSDPFQDRAWCNGRTDGGTGVLCVGWTAAGPHPAPGQRVRARGVLFFPRRPGNPGEPDQRLRLARRGVACVLDVREANNLLVLEPSPSIPGRLAGIRRRGVARLRAVLPGDVAPLAAALLFGVRGGIEGEVRVLFERTGTLHLLAISGLHVVLLAGSIHRLLRLLGTGPRLAAACTILLAVAYVPLTGSAPPIRRAVAGIVLYGFALARGRPADAATALGGAALFQTIYDPHDVYSVGFRLSFSAAAAIAFLAPGWSRAWGARTRFLSRFPAVRADRPVRLFASTYLWRALPASLAAFLATAGWITRSFGRLSPWAPLTNVVVAPLLVVLLPLLALLGAGVNAAALPCALLLRGLRVVLEGADRLPWGHLAVHAPGTGPLILWISGLLFLRARPRCGGLLLATALGVVALTPDEPAHALYLFDVGHGQSALLRPPGGGAILVDAGSRTRTQPGRRILLPALHALGVRRLDRIVCTHFDADHWGAIPDLLHALPVGELIVPSAPPPALARAARRRGVPVVIAQTGDVLYASATSRLVVLESGGAPGWSANDRSLALSYESGGHRILLPADREERGLDRLLSRGLPRYEVLVAPHHGAPCKNAARVGIAVRPHWLLVSGSSWFSDAPTLRAYGAAQILHTSSRGCLVVDAPPKGPLEVRSYGGTNPRARSPR